MRWQDSELLDRDAEQRLCQVLHRQPTKEEIAQLRRGEHALGLEDPAVAKARQVRARAKAIHDLNREIVKELQVTRQHARRGRVLPMKKRSPRSKA